MNIHGHTILTKLKVAQGAWDQQAAWVRGYILALEDVVGDIDTLDRVHDGSCDEFYGALAMTKDRVEETLTQARATLAALEQMEQDYLNHVQNKEQP